MNLILILLMTLAAPAAFQVESSVPYRLLRVFPPTGLGPIQSYDYYVSVPGFLDRPSVERLICSVIEKENPPLGFGISINVYQGIQSEFVFGVPGYAIYVNREGRSGLLSLLKDSQGTEIRPPRTYDFDYTKLCLKK